MSRRCNSPSASGTVSAHTTDTSAMPSAFSVSCRSCGGHPRYRTDFIDRLFRWSSTRPGCGNEMAVALDVHFDPGGAVRPVDQPPVGNASVLGVERDRRQAIAVVGFPLVDLAIAVRILFSGHELRLEEVFDTGD